MCQVLALFGSTNYQVQQISDVGTGERMMRGGGACAVLAYFLLDR